MEFNPVKAFIPGSSWGDLSLFVSYSYTDARYGDFNVVQKTGNELVKSNLKNKRVENAPVNILRTGLNYYIKRFSVTGQLSFVDEAFADANNTLKPTPNGQNGLIPSYTISDLSAQYSFKKIVTLKAGLNNITNNMYFTRRAGGYPGPGLMPSDGRNFFITLGARL